MDAVLLISAAVIFVFACIGVAAVFALVGSSRAKKQKSNN
jgi:flagellar basal body-associated protein FliL